MRGKYVDHLHHTGLDAIEREVNIFNYYFTSNTTPNNDMRREERDVRVCTASKVRECHECITAIHPNDVATVVLVVVVYSPFLPHSAMVGTIVIVQ